MSQTPSSMLPLQTIAPNFDLYDVVSGKNYRLSEQPPSVGTVIMFICNHCPYVIHIQKKIVEVANLYMPQRINFIAINSNDVVNYPADHPDKMLMIAKQHQYPFAYLFDETQSVAKAYQAACTPDFFVFDRDLRCVYRGRFDAATPGNQAPVTGQDLSAALDSLINHTAPSNIQQPSLGCNIKWKK